jgi:hypothetical protein
MCPRSYCASLTIWGLLLSMSLVMLVTPYLTSRGWRSSFRGAYETYGPISGPETVSPSSFSGQAGEFPPSEKPCLIPTLSLFLRCHCKQSRYDLNSLMACVAAKDHTMSQW